MSRSDCVDESSTPVDGCSRQPPSRPRPAFHTDSPNCLLCSVAPQNDDMYSEGIQIDERHRPIVRTNKGPLRIACVGSAFRTTWPESPSDASTVTPPSFKQVEEGKVGPRPEVPTRCTFPKFEPHTQPRGVPHGAHRRTRAGEMPHQLRSGKQKNQTGTPLAASRCPPTHTSATLAHYSPK